MVKVSALHSLNNTNQTWCRVILFLTFSIYLGIPSTFSYYSPGGLWGNTLLGVGFTSECDPGGFYIASAHQIFDADGRNIFLGHPGITLQLVLGLIQVVYFKLTAPAQAVYAEYIARNLDVIYFISKLIMSFFTVLSLFVVYYTGRIINLSKYGALASCLGFATSLPVLYYLSRVSAEPFMIIFVLLTIIAMHSGRQIQVNTTIRLNFNVIFRFMLAGAFTSMAIYTKINLVAIFPGLCLFYILLTAWPQRYFIMIFNYILPYIVGFTVFFFSLLPFINWRYFFATWASPTITPATQDPQGVMESVFFILERFLQLFYNIVFNITKLDLLPGLTIQGVFNLVETPYIVSGLVGLVLILQFKKVTPELLLLLALVLWTVFLWWFRGTTRFLLAWHYLFIFTAFISLCFGFLLDFVYNILQTKYRNYTPILLVVTLFVVHYTSIWCYVDSRILDIKYYNEFSSFFFKIQHTIRQSDKVAILCYDDISYSRANIYHGLDGSYSLNKPSNLLLNMPIQAINVRKFSSIDLLYFELVSKGFTKFINFADKFDNTANTQPIEEILWLNISFQTAN